MITDFRLDERPRVATLCQITLIKRGEKYSPRLRLWKRDKTRPQVKSPVEHGVPESPATTMIKATVDTDDCHENFWKLMDFVTTFSGVEVPEHNFRIVPGGEALLLQAMRLEDRQRLIAIIAKALGGSLTEEDLALLADRKGALEVFRKLLYEPDYFEGEKRRGRFTRDEDVWQTFFERNQWIFGYGLNLIACESVDDEKLEQLTTGRSIFTGAGKRSDGALRTRGYISSLLFVEIKTATTPLLTAAAYRPPDVYSASKELAGAIAQVQKTAAKAVRGIMETSKRMYAADGASMGFEVNTVRPRQVVVIGQLSQLSENDQVNQEQSMSFELMRRDLHDVEVITFDELYERALFIVSGGNQVEAG